MCEAVERGGKARESEAYVYRCQVGDVFVIISSQPIEKRFNCQAVYRKPVRTRDT